MNPNHEMLSFVQRAAAHPSQGCTIATCLVSLSLYGYLPNKPLNLIFIVAFAISFIGHMFLAVRRRAWSFLVALGIGTLLEVVGNNTSTSLRTYAKIARILWTSCIAQGSFQA